jgi:ribosomal protein L20
LIAGLHRAEVVVDRKILADLAVTEPETFTQLVGVATSALADGDGGEVLAVRGPQEAR